MILHGVARKKAHKAAIIVERVAPVSNEFLFAVPSVWDPLSVGTAKGAAVELSPLLEAAGKRDGAIRKVEDDESKKKNSSPASKNSVRASTVSHSKEEGFIPMVNLTSEWTEVGKGGKKFKDKRLKTPQFNKDSKKRKFS